MADAKRILSQFKRTGYLSIGEVLKSNLIAAGLIYEANGKIYLTGNGERFIKDA